MDDIRQWLEQIGFDKYADLFAEQRIGYDVIGELSEQDLKEFGLPFGDRKRLLREIQLLDESAIEPAVGVSASKAEHLDTSGGAERRQLTVMFCDLVGSTELSQQFDPEDLGKLIASFHNACKIAISRFDGYVAKYMGDGLLVYFGYPIAHEDDAERAVRAGLDVIDQIASLDLSYGVDLAARIGIATGLVVVGDLIGEGASEERSVLGETPNLAARLQGIAPRGGVIIAESTRHLISGRIDVEALKPFSLKGFSKAVQAYRAIAVHAASRFEAATSSGLTPFVGREIELDLLTDRWQQACSGEGQAVILSGEAGIGKSRILSEMCDHVESTSHIQLRYQCSPYGANTAFLPVIDELRSSAEFTEDDSDDDRLDKLEQLIGERSGAIDTASPLLAALMSLPVGRYPILELSPARQKLEAITLLVEQLEALARSNPMIVLIEDVHWIDPSTLEVFDAMVECIPALPVLMVVTHRPEFDRRWQEFGHVTHHSLNRLSRQDGRTLARKVTINKAIPETVLEQILEHTDGVPLFVEELVKTVLESEQAQGGDGHFISANMQSPMAIPTTLKDSLMARLDRITAAKEVAQAAACIGREFSSALLASIIDIDGLEEKLNQLVNAGLIFRRSSGDRTRYIFKHALVQDTARESLLVSRRQQLHAYIAQALASSDDPDPAILAHHFAIAGMHLNSAENYLAAGLRSLRLSALTEATRELERGLQATEAIEPGAARDDLELDIRIALGSARMALFGWPHASVSDAFERAFDLAEASGRQQAFGPILWGLCVHYWTRSEFQPTLYWLDKLELIADKIKDAELSAVRDMTAGCQYFWQAEHHRARRYTTHIRKTYDQRHLAHIVTYTNHDPLVFSLHWAGGLLEWIIGYPDRGLEMVDQAVALARQIGHPFNSAFALTGGSECLALRGDTERLLEHCDEADAIIEQEGLGDFALHMMSNNWRGRALTLQGEFEDGHSLTAHTNEFWKTVGGRVCSALFWSSESLALHGLGQQHEAMQLIDSAIQYCRDTGDCWLEPEALRIKGEFLLNEEMPRPDAAVSAFTQSLKVAREHDAKSWELRTATSLAQFWYAEDKHGAARELLEPLYNWFSEGLDTQDLLQAKAVLEKLQ